MITEHQPSFKKVEREPIVPDDQAIVAYGDWLLRRMSSLKQYIVIPVEPEEVECLRGVQLVHRADHGGDFAGELVAVVRR